MLRITGYSDDIVCYEDDGNVNEVDCYDRDVEFQVYDGDPSAPAGGVRVVMSYGVRDAVWSATVERLREGMEIPWTIAVVPDPDCRYGIAVLIDPDGSDQLGYEVRTVKSRTGG